MSHATRRALLRLTKRDGRNPYERFHGLATGAWPDKDALTLDRLEERPMEEIEPC